MRDRRLDFWRGLCLVDMVLVHLVHEGIQFGALAPLIVDYTRFAAGGFVFVAGVGVGMVAGLAGAPRAARGPGTFYRRALHLLGVHYVLTALVIVAETARGWRAPVADPIGLLRDVVLLRIAPSYIDVLPLYVAMLAASPLLTALVRRGHWPLVAAASATAFAYGRFVPMAASPPASGEFPFLLWQAFFVAGLLFSALIPRLDARPRRWLGALAVACSAFAILTALALGPASAAFVKVPLTTAELLRYLAATLVVVTTSAVAWRRIGGRVPVRAIVTLGRRSLAVYGGHVFVQMVVVALVTPLWWLGAGQALAALPMLAALWMLARTIDAWHADARPAAELRRALRSWGAPPAGAVAAAALLLALGAGSGNRAGELSDDGPADRVVELVPNGSAIDVVDAPAEQSLELDAATVDDTPAAAEPAIETLDDDAPLESRLFAPRYA